jgi:hypothetical protein
MGIGFPGDKPLILPKNAWFFRGNHDNPLIANENPQCLGDWGFKNIEGICIFWISGAWSLDYAVRTDGVDWWHDEELSILQLQTAILACSRIKPDIILSHDAPYQAGLPLLKSMQAKNNPEIFKTRTGQALTALFEQYQPKQWIFGHYHYSWSKFINHTKFQCLNELEMCEV